MRSKRITIHIPHPLYDAAQQQRRDKRFRSIARYIIGAIVHQILADTRQHLIRELANADPEEQDEIIAYFLRAPTDKPTLLTWIDRKGRTAP